MHSKSIQKLIKAFLGLPSVGSRTATRFALHLIKSPNEEVKTFIKAIIEAKENTKLCFFCFNPFESFGKEKFCEICSESRRDRRTICIVEKESDLIAINQLKIYRGLFFILGGTLSPLRKENIKKIRIKELLDRINNPKKYNIEQLEEIIIATNFTSEGEATALYIERVIKSSNIKITRLARGLPKGSELEYIDEETISCSFKDRKEK